MFFDKLKDSVIDKVTDTISDKIEEISGGQIQIDSILKGQIKIDGNKYVDKVLESLNQRLTENGLNSIGLPSQDIDFEKEVACGIKLSGQAQLLEGTISGLASFCRFEDTGVEINAIGDPLIFGSTSIGFKQTEVNYSIKIKVWCYSQEASIEGSLKDVQVSLGFKVGRDFSVHMNKFDLKYNGDLDLQFKDLEAFEFLSDLISDDLRTTIKESVVEYLQKTIKSYITDILGKLGISL